MNKYIIGLALKLVFCTYSYAQNTLQIKILSDQKKEPLLGATAYIESLEKGAITNFDGIALLKDIPDGRYEVRISYLGFETMVSSITVPIKDELLFYLKETANALDEVILRSIRSTRTIKKIPTRIEFIGVEELGEKAIMNPTNISMVLRESTGIQMQQTSLSSTNTNIRIQGLDGRYTQLLRDGFPLYGGFSSGLSILQIPPLDLQQFEIVKGSSSTLYGGGAIAGLVNLVSKVPEEFPQMDIMLTQTHALGSTANIFYAERKNKWGWTLYGTGHHQKAYDPDDDEFSNLPQTRSISFNPRLFYYPSEKTTMWFGITGTFEDRKGGDITKIKLG
ncbi:MAG: TonB-dependent receptor plug domain-containing protein, partial [Allomuricauda sp.]